MKLYRPKSIGRRVSWPDLRLSHNVSLSATINIMASPVKMTLLLFLYFNHSLLHLLFPFSSLWRLGGGMPCPLPTGTSRKVWDVNTHNYWKAMYTYTTVSVVEVHHFLSTDLTLQLRLSIECYRSVHFHDTWNLSLPVHLPYDSLKVTHEVLTSLIHKMTVTLFNTSISPAYEKSSGPMVQHYCLGGSFPIFVYGCEILRFETPPSCKAHQHR